MKPMGKAKKLGNKNVASSAVVTKKGKKGGKKC